MRLGVRRVRRGEEETGGKVTEPVSTGTTLKRTSCEEPGGSRRWQSFSPQNRNASFSEKLARDLNGRGAVLDVQSQMHLLAQHALKRRCQRNPEISLTDVDWRQGVAICDGGFAVPTASQARGARRRRRKQSRGSERGKSQASCAA